MNALHVVLKGLDLVSRGQRLATHAPELVRGGVRGGADLALGLGALLRTGALRPLPPFALVEVGRQVAREGAKSHVLYTINGLRDPDKAAFIFEDRRISWGAVLNRTKRLANHLRSRGVGPGDTVAIMLPNRPEFLETQAAALRLGASTAFINPRAPEAEARSLLARAKAKVLVTHRAEVGGEDVATLLAGAPYERALQEAPSHDPQVSKDSESKVVIFTSGTTGRPKGAVRDMANAPLVDFLGLLRALPFRHDDVHMVVAPLYHSSGSGFAAMAEVLGNTLVLVEHFSPQAFCEHVEEHQVTTTCVVPTMLHKLCEWEGARDHDLSSLRLVVCTGAALRPEVREAARDLLGDVIHDLYGSTEMAWVSVASPEDQRRKPASVGKPVPGVEVRILDPEGREVPTGEIGEVWARSGILMEGYLDDPELGAERLREGFVSVKDLGFLDHDGYLHVVDRADDMIISGGVNVYPAEVEVALGAHEAVSEAAVVGVPDPEWGERVVALVVARREIPPEELISWCKDQVSYAAVPKEIRFADALPRNDVGKVNKKTIVADW